MKPRWGLIPWRVRFIFKLLVRVFPVKYEIWQSIGLFKHGNMQSPKFGLELIQQFARCIGTSQGKTVLELGPGDSVNTAIIARALEFEKSVLIEHNGCYYTNGIRSFNELADKSVDLIFSNAVLEHIEGQEINLLMQESYRVLKKNGKAIHRVDFRDHIKGDFNHLRYSDLFWNSKFIKRAGCYINRLHPDQFIESAQAVGFNVEVTRESASRKTNHIKINACLPRHKNQGQILEGFDLVLTKVN